MTNEMVKANKNEMMAAGAPLGFDDEASEGNDLILARVKVLNAMSPEIQDLDGYKAGDIINTLSKEKLNDKVFIPVKKYTSNIHWKPQGEDGMYCSSFDGVTGYDQELEQEIKCRECRKNEFDNSKEGAEAKPKCTKYMNFLGFFEGEPMPVVLSFAKTNYAEGRKLFSLAKITMQNMWNHGYKLVNKQKTSRNYKWQIIDIVAAGPTSEEDRAIGMQLFMAHEGSQIKADVSEDGGSSRKTNEVADDSEMESSEF